MAYLYCKKHGKEAIESAVSKPDRSEKSKEYMKVTCGLLLEDFYCDRCNQELPTNSIAYLIQYFPSSEYESPNDFTEYFNDPIFVAYKPEKEDYLPESMDCDYIAMCEIKNVSPDDIRNLYKKIWRVRD
jgi:hypothetical protein